MKFLSVVILCFAVAACAKPAKRGALFDGGPIATADVSDWRREDTLDPSDWKFAHGWDGTTLPPIGDVVSSPNATANGVLNPDNIGGVYICEDINWGGKCGYAVQPTNVCIHLGSDWNKKISSFGPDNCNACYVWDDAHCHYNIPGAGGPAQPPVWYFEYPGDATGGGLGHDNPWNDRISSFMYTATSCR